MEAICFDGVSKVYGDGTWAVGSLDLEIQEGELVAFVGLPGLRQSDRAVLHERDQLRVAGAFGLRCSQPPPRSRGGMRRSVPLPFRQHRLVNAPTCREIPSTNGGGIRSLA